MEAEVATPGTGGCDAEGHGSSGVTAPCLGSYVLAVTAEENAIRAAWNRLTILPFACASFPCGLRGGWSSRGGNKGQCRYYKNFSHRESPVSGGIVCRREYRALMVTQSLPCDIGQGRTAIHPRRQQYQSPIFSARAPRLGVWGRRLGSCCIVAMDCRGELMLKTADQLVKAICANPEPAKPRHSPNRTIAD